MSRILNEPITASREIGGGRNSKVFALTCKSKESFAAKFYYSDSHDLRDRQGNEFSSLSFLWRNGIRCVPEPIVMDRSLQVAIYRFVNGKKLGPASVGSEHIEQCVGFLGSLKDLCDQGRREGILVPASEACFSFGQLSANLEKRFQRLREAAVSQPELRSFLESELAPLYQKFLRIGQQADSVLDVPLQEQILSPSDFGFHNALQEDAGKLTFLDFEYFGWDDAAKTISDFILHPGMDLSEDTRQQFKSRALTIFDGGNRLARRLELVYPLYALKWCFIILNEFLPERLLRRSFAALNGEKINERDVQNAQLSKARTLLNRITKEL